MSVVEAIRTIDEQFTDHEEIDIEIDEIKAQVETLVSEYDVPLEEAKRSVRNSILDDHGVDRETFYTQQSRNELVGCGEIREDEQWIDVQAQVVDLWESKSDAIAQVGLLGDDSGTVKFVSFETSDLPLLEEDEAYRLENVVTDEYQGRYSVKLNRTTKIEQLEEDVDVADRDTTKMGAIVKIQPGSGLIKRCPEEDCTRVLQNGRCSEHGERKGEFDLRIKAVLDDGDTVRDVLFDREQTAAITGMSLSDASELAMDALSTEVVHQQIKEQLVGRYLEVEGPEVGRYLLVNDATRRDGPAANEIAELK